MHEEFVTECKLDDGDLEELNTCREVYICRRALGGPRMEEFKVEDCELARKLCKGRRRGC